MKKSLFMRAVAAVSTVPLALTQCLTVANAVSVSGTALSVAEDTSVAISADAKEISLTGENGLLYIEPKGYGEFDGSDVKGYKNVGEATYETYSEWYLDASLLLEQTKEKAPEGPFDIKKYAKIFTSRAGAYADTFNQLINGISEAKYKVNDDNVTITGKIDDLTSVVTATGSGSIDEFIDSNSGLFQGFDLSDYTGVLTEVGVEGSIVIVIDTTALKTNGSVKATFAIADENGKQIEDDQVVEAVQKKFAEQFQKVLDKTFNFDGGFKAANVNEAISLAKSKAEGSGYYDKISGNDKYNQNKDKIPQDVDSAASSKYGKKMYDTLVSVAKNKAGKEIDFTEQNCVNFVNKLTDITADSNGKDHVTVFTAKFPYSDFDEASKSEHEAVVSYFKSNEYDVVEDYKEFIVTVDYADAFNSNAAVDMVYKRVVKVQPIVPEDTTPSGTTPVDTTPSGSDTTPVDTTPSGSDTTPVDTTPSGSDTTPVDTTPSGSDTTPAGSDTTPVGSNTTPAGSDTTPVGSNTTPAGSETTPAGSDTTPAGSDTTPAGSDTTPVGSNTTPVGTDTTPTGSDVVGGTTTGSDIAGGTTTGSDVVGGTTTTGSDIAGGTTTASTTEDVEAATRVVVTTAVNVKVNAKYEQGFYLNIDPEFHKEQIDTLTYSVDSMKLYYSVKDDSFIGSDVIEAGTKYEIPVDSFDFGDQTPSNKYVENNNTFAYQVVIYATKDIVDEATGMTVAKAGEEIKLVSGAEASVTAYIGVKGDANLDSKVDAGDASDVLVYYAALSTGGKKDKTWFAKNSFVLKALPEGVDPADHVLDSFAAFLADVSEGTTTDPMNWTKKKAERTLEAGDSSSISAHYALLMTEFTEIGDGKEAWEATAGAKL